MVGTLFRVSSYPDRPVQVVLQYLNVAHSALTANFEKLLLLPKALKFITSSLSDKTDKKDEKKRVVNF